MKSPETDTTAQLSATVSETIDPLKAFEAGLKSQPPTEIFPGLIVHHEQLKVADKTRERLAESMRSEYGPLNPAGMMTMLTAESFAAAITNHGDQRTKVFADSENGAITAVFDYLENGPEGADRSHGWGQHRAEIKFTESRKLKEWRKTLEEMSQEQFANFIEDHLEDVVKPAGQELLSIATDLEASSSGNFKGRVNLANGDIALHYQNDVETTVAVPRTLTLGIPLFEHGDRYSLGARLRFRIRGGSVTFRLLFTNLQDAKDQEFERIVQEIEEKTSASIYRGRLALPW